MSRNKVHPLTRAKLRKKRERLRQGRDHARFEAAMLAERLGPHPGRVELRVRVEIALPGTNLGWPLFGKPLGVLVTSEEEARQVQRACEAGVKAWLAGRLRGGEIV